MDSSVGGSEKWETRAPVGFAKFRGSAAQLWSVAPAGPSGNASNGKLLDAKDNQCLNVVAFTGPDVGLDPCKPAGSGNDGNEIFELKESSALSGHRLAVAFFNRGYQTAAVRSRSPLSLLRTARSNSGARRR